jgi:hypothetical protein
VTTYRFGYRCEHQVIAVENSRVPNTASARQSRHAGQDALQQGNRGDWPVRRLEHRHLSIGWLRHEADDAPLGDAVATREQIIDVVDHRLGNEELGVAHGEILADHLAVGFEGLAISGSAGAQRFTGWRGSNLPAVTGQRRRPRPC